jgi:PKD repeat protein
MSTTRRLGVAAALCAVSACTVEKTPAPLLSGPSELAVRVAMQIVPDSILQDGAAQAVLQIDAAGPDGRPVRGLGLRVEVLFNGSVQDFGTLSAKWVVTGEDGRARVIYTAPPRPAEPTEQGNVVTFSVEPIGNDYRGEVQRTVDLRLVTPGVILPPNSAPEPAFTFSPGAPLPLTDIVFDASTTLDEGRPCGASCSYRWDFGDGESATGVFVKHQYRTGGTYQVRLTVTDVRGASSTLAQPLTVGPAVPPTAAFTFSPTTIATGQTIFFNAESSRPATGRRLVSYDWDFGSGRFGSGVTTTKSYDSAGTYTVTLTVTDDAGEKATASQTITVGTPGTTATVFVFDAGASGGPSRIVEVRNNVGDRPASREGARADAVRRRALARGRFARRSTSLRRSPSAAGLSAKRPSAPSAAAAKPPFGARRRLGAV